jgi:lysophospholipase L1-like esterase
MRMTDLVLVLFATTVLSLSSWAGDDAVVPPAAKQDPLTPERGYFKDYPKAWNNFHKFFLDRTAKGDIDVLFIGDSITQGWDNQKELWKKEYEPLKAANFGIGGDRTQQVLWRILNGEIDGLHPKVVVLLIGVNNIWPNDPSERIGAGIKKIVETLREKLPQTKVLVLGVLPSGKNATDGVRERIKQINAVVAKLDDGKDVRYLDLGPKFLEADGSIAPDKFYKPDVLHLAPKGYEVWAEAMRALLSELLKP